MATLAIRPLICISAGACEEEEERSPMAEKEGGNGGTSRPGNNRQLSRGSGRKREAREKSGRLRVAIMRDWGN